MTLRPLVTRAFDQAVVSASSLFEDFALDIELSEVEVRLVPVKEIRRAIVTGHYSGVMPDATQEAFAAYWNEVVIAAVAYGPGGNSRTFGAVIEGFDSSNARELIRLWVHPDAPKNTASFVVSKSLKMLPKQVGLVVSFADSGQGHAGYVYQSLNFYYCGMSGEGVRYVDSSGVEVTARLANVYRMRNPEKFAGMSLTEIRNCLGWTAVKSHAKHRYCIGVGKLKKSVSRELQAKALPYPKGATIESAGQKRITPDPRTDNSTIGRSQFTAEDRQ
jgi:hypothetical protein